MENIEQQEIQYKQTEDIFDKTMIILGLVFSLLGISCCGFFGIAGSIISLVEMHRNPNNIQPKVGAIIGILSVIAWMILIITMIILYYTRFHT